MLPTKTEVKQGEFVEFISLAKGYSRKKYSSQNLNPISPIPKVTFGIIQIKVKYLSTSFQRLDKKKNICKGREKLNFDLLLPPPGWGKSL